MDKQKSRLLAAIRSQGIDDDRVLEALERVPRELFVPPDERSLSYYNHPLPIGHGQTISQPYTVAFMAELLDPRPGNYVLEIGGGSGYNAAVLRELVGSSGKIITIERIPELADMAQYNLHQAGYEDVKVIQGDGKVGHPDASPYDRIMVTAQTNEIPSKLIEQLKDGGRMVIPLSFEGFCSMTLFIKDSLGQHSMTHHGAFLFVPLI